MTTSRAMHDTRAAAALLIALLMTLSTLLIAPPAEAKGPPEPVRFATFNASLNRGADGQALSDLSAPFDAAEPDAALRRRRAQAAAVAEIIQRTRPEVLLVNEFDYVDGPVTGNALTAAFQANYLGVSQNGQAPIHYPHVFVAPSNTGMPSGFDYDNSASVGGPGDAHGFGFFPGQFGMAVFSQHPIDYQRARTFRLFRWADMPGALLPDDPATPAPADWYSETELNDPDHGFRLSSKSHWDLPLDIGGTPVHFLVSHPTPPVFDDPPQFPAGVDFNGRRNFDEIRLWADYVTPGAGGYIYDDSGTFGGLKPGSKFVIAGDQNSDPLDGDSIPGSIQQLLDNPRINTTATPSSVGGAEWADVQGELNDGHRTDPAIDTADFCDTPAFPPCSGPGNLRADYVLPSRNLRIVDSAVFWPEPGSDLVYLTGTGFPVPSSDHRLVWLDLMVPGSARH